MMTKKHYPLHPDIQEALAQHPFFLMEDFDDEEILEWLDDAILQAMHHGLIRASVSHEYPDRMFSEIENAAKDFLTPLKIAVKRGLVQVEPRPTEEGGTTGNPVFLREGQIFMPTDSGRHIFSRMHAKKDKDENEDGYADEYEYEPEHSSSACVTDDADPDWDEESQLDDQGTFRQQVLSVLYQKPWINLWVMIFRGWSHEKSDLLAELEKQDLIELRYPEKGVGDIEQEFMLSPFGIIKFLTQQSDHVGLNQARNNRTRALVHQARGLLEQMGFKITSHKANMVENNLFAPDITFATDEGYLLNALVESEPFLGYEAVEKYQVMWHKNFYNTIQNKMYVFCENKQVLRDVLNFIMSRYEDVKPPGIYLCNLEEAERNMQEKGHPWSIVQTPGRQEAKAQNAEPEQSGTIEPKENNP